MSYIPIKLKMAERGFCSPGLRFVRQGIHVRLPNGKLREECGSHFDVSLHKTIEVFLLANALMGS